MHVTYDDHSDAQLAKCIVGPLFQNAVLCQNMMDSQDEMMKKGDEHMADIAQKMIGFHLVMEHSLYYIAHILYERGVLSSDTFQEALQEVVQPWTVLEKKGELGEISVSELHTIISLKLP
jgi:hypothetical protein